MHFSQKGNMKKDNMKYDAYTISDNSADMMIDKTDSHDVNNLARMILDTEDDKQYDRLFKRNSISDLLSRIIAGVFIMNLIIVFISQFIHHVL